MDSDFSELAKCIEETRLVLSLRKGRSREKYIRVDGIWERFHRPVAEERDSSELAEDADPELRQRDSFQPLPWDLEG